jgi:hypothetical protein
MKRCLVAVLIVVFAAGAGYAQVQKSLVTPSQPPGLTTRPEPAGFRGAEVIGQRPANFGADTDTITVGEEKGKFRRIGLEIDGNDVEVRRIVIEFGNGDRLDVAMGVVFQEGERSRSIDLPGEKRFIRTITLHYRTVGSLREGRGTVRVYGID